MIINRNYLELKDSYLFYEMDQRVARFKEENPRADVISLGIGDVTLPVSVCVAGAMKKAADEMATGEGMRGYGPYEGYAFLREAIRAYYGARGVDVGTDELFVADGAKSDLGNMLDIFSCENTVLIPDPVYPAYVDANVMDGRRILYADATAANNFKPMPDGRDADILYLCSPNNPTGAVYSRSELKIWVDYALARGALILFDAAYEAFVRDPELPRSIFEIEGARGCAIEFCSLSKTAGFTGLRCSYVTIPRELTRGGVKLGSLWLRRQSTKYNGLPYVIQRGAQAAISDEGLRDARAMVAYYLENTKLIGQGLERLGLEYEGGRNSPYIWLKCPGGLDSWTFFGKLLEKAAVVGTPGAGFGRNGEGRFRLTGFGNRERVAQAVERFGKAL